MPLTGFLCCKDHEAKPFEECIEECRKGNCLYPLHLLARIPRKLKDREGIPHDFSTTALSMCPRRFALEERFEYAEHPQDFIARDRGDSHHHWVEQSGPFPGVTMEARFYKRYETPGGHFVLSGKPDWVDYNLGEIGDHKTTSYAPKSPYPNHEAQVNVYADLVGEDISRLWIEYFDGRSYQKHDVRVWSEEERQTFITERGYELVKVRNNPGYLPPKLPDFPKAMDCKYCPVRELCEGAEEDS